MAQLNFPADTAIKPPPHGNFGNGQGSNEIPILSLLKESYLLWHNFLGYLPRLTRYTLGMRIDNLFTDLIATTLTAQYAKREQKLLVLTQLAQKLDHLKYFVTILWEAGGLEANKYSQLAQKLNEAGTMLGAWIRKLETIK